MGASLVRSASVSRRSVSRRAPFRSKTSRTRPPRSPVALQRCVCGAGLLFRSKAVLALAENLPKIVDKSAVVGRTRCRMKRSSGPSRAGATTIRDTALDATSDRSATRGQRSIATKCEPSAADFLLNLVLQIALHPFLPCDSNTQVDDPHAAHRGTWRPPRAP
jgi:hypothetical protein